MSYMNGKEVLPEEVLVLVQKYFSGGLMYIPSPHEQKSWGANSGIRKQLAIRNAEIRKKKKQGANFESLMSEYHLSYDSVKKIVYGKIAKK